METVYEVVRIKQVIQEIEPDEKHQIRSPEDAVAVEAEFIGDEDRVVFLVMCLSVKNQVVAVHRCHVGSLNSSIVAPREVFKAAIVNNSDPSFCRISIRARLSRHPPEDIEGTKPMRKRNSSV